MVLQICFCNSLFSNMIYLGKAESHSIQIPVPIHVAKKDLQSSLSLFYSKKKWMHSGGPANRQTRSLNHAPNIL